MVDQVELVEALTALHDEVVRAFGVINPKRRLGRALAKSETALAKVRTPTTPERSDGE